jgi:acetyl-CoA carboxylase carboxyltransferase component
MVAQLYQRGKALSIASIFGIDDTIDPSDTRQWLATLLRTVRTPGRRTGKKRPAIDTW